MSTARRPGPAAERMQRLLAARVDSARLMRGIEIAERGRIGGIEVIRGRVTAVATGSRSDPYWVEVRMPPTGELPDRPAALVFSCSCPDWGDPCKHAVALTLAIGDRLDKDPTLAERLLGSPARPAATPSAPRRMGKPSVGADRPAWAAEVPDRRPPATADELFGAMGQAQVRTVIDVDPAERVRELGALPVNGVDLAPYLLTLLDRLRGG